MQERAERCDAGVIDGDGQLNNQWKRKLRFEIILFG